MRPRSNIENIRKALRHPRLLWLFIKGYDEVELAKEHIAIHLGLCSKSKINEGGLDLIELVCRAIDLRFNSCYHTEYLYLVCLHTQANKIVETGVHYGASSAFILKALRETGGRLYSIDLPSVKYQRDNGTFHFDELPSSTNSGFVVPEPLKDNWELILGDSREKLPKLLQSIGQIDMFHHDSMHTYDLMTFEYETVWPYLNHGGLLLSDDAHWNNAFKDFCHRHSVKHRIHRGIGIEEKSG